MTRDDDLKPYRDAAPGGVQTTAEGANTWLPVGYSTSSASLKVSAVPGLVVFTIDDPNSMLPTAIQLVPDGARELAALLTEQAEAAER